MARRTGRAATTENTTPEASNEAPTTEEVSMTAGTVEDTEVSTQPDDENVEATGDESTEAPAATTAEAPAESDTFDLTDFEAAIATALEDADTSTGEVPPASLGPVTNAYQALPSVKAKNAAKKLVNEAMKDSMNSGDFIKARGYLDVSDKALVAGGGTKTATEKAPADPTEAFVQRLATLSLAYSEAYSNVPEGVAENWNERLDEVVEANRDAVTAQVAWLTGDEETRGEEPEGSPFVKAAAKLAIGKSARPAGTRSGGGGGTPHSGPRGDIGAHIREVFAGEEVGTFLKIGEIRKRATSGYASDQASQGAISARLFPDNGAESAMVKFGIQPEIVDGKKGARKVADEPTSE